MSEHKLYLENKTGWVMAMMHKYLPRDQFPQTMRKVAEEATQDDKDAANQAYQDYKDVTNPRLSK